MGPQSCGKSTIAKIISFCQWSEKRYLLDGKFEYDVNEQLLDFHRLDKNYFSKDSLFEYESNFLKISCNGKKMKLQFESKGHDIEYNKSKNIYIPSERNFVSAIPNLSKYNETNDNVMSFVYDWYTAKRQFTKQNLLPVLKLGIKFYNDSKNDSDILILNETKKEIPLRTGSSGLQSIVPLVLILDYLTSDDFYKLSALSVHELTSINDFIQKTYPEFLNKPTDFDDDVKRLQKRAEIRLKRGNYHHVNFILEEPEQNLFPETQRDLIYYILNKIKSQHNHSLTLTTHSPYVLYAINNCILGDLIADKLTSDETNSFLSKNAWISGDKVNIYEIKEGMIKSIKNPKTGTVDKHYFNNIMNKIMDEYYEMLHFLSHEK